MNLNMIILYIIRKIYISFLFVYYQTTIILYYVNLYFNFFSRKLHGNLPNYEKFETFKQTPQHVAIVVKNPKKFKNQIVNLVCLLINFGIGAVTLYDKNGYMLENDHYFIDKIEKSIKCHIKKNKINNYVTYNKNVYINIYDFHSVEIQYDEVIMSSKLLDSNQLLRRILACIPNSNPNLILLFNNCNSLDGFFPINIHQSEIFIYNQVSLNYLSRQDSYAIVKRKYPYWDYPIPDWEYKQMWVWQKVRNRVYRNVFEVDREVKYGDTMNVLLNCNVEGIGIEGEVVSVDKKLARDLLIPSQQALYTSTENLEKMKIRMSKKKSDDSFKISENLAKTIRLLECMTLPIPMNGNVDWILNKYHIRIALRRAGVIIPLDKISVPDNISTAQDVKIQVEINPKRIITINSKIFLIDKTDNKMPNVVWKELDFIVGMKSNMKIPGILNNTNI
ncbi:39S ribosomal protein L9, mitochondrial [Intoshia linei]|uniref:Large ribosomal subunit protein bL9m n=1 Tax=Intoshia linei TaxID=1819745 RepID=A0A177AYN4_9BILA|nr:39S ribosomal protein L9, mitochondrial [Intoshia linei]